MRRRLGGTHRHTAPRQHRHGTGGAGDDGMTRDTSIGRGHGSAAHGRRRRETLDLHPAADPKARHAQGGHPAGRGEQQPTARGQFDSPMLVALARAFYWQQLLDDGVVASGTEIAQREGLHHSTVNELLRLTLLTLLEPAIFAQRKRARRIPSPCIWWSGGGSNYRPSHCECDRYPFKTLPATEKHHQKPSYRSTSEHLKTIMDASPLCQYCARSKPLSNQQHP